MGLLGSPFSLVNDGLSRGTSVDAGRAVSKLIVGLDVLSLKSAGSEIVHNAQILRLLSKLSAAGDLEFDTEDEGKAVVLGEPSLPSLSLSLALPSSPSDVRCLYE